jgi:hypothetical protein
MLIGELFAYIWAEQKDTVSGETPLKVRKKNDHAVNAMEYLLTSAPMYVGPIDQEDLDRFYAGLSIEEYQERFGDDDDEEDEPVCRITGY